MNSRTLRAGVVGVGSLGQHHARIYTEIDGVELVGVVDADPARAEEIAAKNGVPVFADVEALAREIDLATVATPTLTHEPAAQSLLEAGVATLVEKPIAPDRESGRRLVDLASRKKIPLMVGHTERFNPVVSALIEACHQPRFLEMHRLAPFVRRGLDVDVVLDLMIHDLDLARVILGRPEVESFLASGSPALTEKIDIATVRLRFAGGAGANITASRISSERMRKIRVFERDGYLTCDAMSGEANALRIHSQEGGEPEMRKQLLPKPDGEPLGRELRAFAAAVRSGDVMPVTGEDGLAALDLALTVRDAILKDL